MSEKTIDPVHLVQAWVHSHEEDTATSIVYRPSNFPFPPSRGRKGFQLHADGTLSACQLGPADKPTTAAGTWKLTGEQLELSPQGQSTQILCLEAVEPDRLVVQKKPTCLSK